VKKCISCGVNKSLDMFWKKAKNIDGRDNKCGECSKSYHRKIYSENDKRKQNVREAEKRAIARNKKLVQEYKEKYPCVDCNISDTEVLSFDHIVGQKRFNISDGVQRGVGEETLLKEIAKCEIVCMNCHTKRTKRRHREKTSELV